MGIYLKDVTLVRNAGTPWETRVLDSITLHVRPGEAVCLMGDSGAGKSSLLKVMAGLLPPSGGSYENKLGAPPGLVFQEPHRGFFAASVWEEVAYGPENTARPAWEVKRRTKEALLRVDVTRDLWDKSPFRLSGGEQRRVALASVLALEPKALLLDEPNIGMDRFGRETLNRLIYEERKRRNNLVVIASHDPELLFKLTDRVIFLRQGRIALDAAWSAWRNLIDHLPQHGGQLPVGLEALAKLAQENVITEQEIGSPDAVVRVLRRIWGEKCRNGRS